MSAALNYTDFAIESSIESLKLMNQYKLINLTLESDFILECMDCGVLSAVCEAEQGSSIFAKIKESIKKFFNKVIGLFRDRSKEKADKYVPWIKENVKTIKSRSENMTIELTPYWDADWRDDIKTMTNVVDKIFNNIKNGKYQDYKFADDLVTLGTSVSDTENLKQKLIVRFSVGEKDKTGMKQVKVDNFGKTKTLDNMFEFIFNYAGDVPNALNQLEKDIERKLDQVNPKTLTIKESTYLDIEGRYVAESDLVTLINYMEIITEDGKESGTTNTDGESTSDTSVKVNPDGEEGKGTPEDNEKDKKEDDKSNEERSTYISQCESFLKTMVTAFLTASEKRFVVYTNTMVAVGNSNGSPTRDEEGNVEDKEGSEGDTSDKTNEGDGNKSMIGKIVDKGKEALKNVTSGRAKTNKDKDKK